MLYLSYTSEAGVAWASLEEFERDELMRNMKSMISQFARHNGQVSGDLPCRKLRVEGLRSAMLITFHAGENNDMELVVNAILRQPV